MNKRDLELKISYLTDYIGICHLQSQYLHYIQTCMYTKIPPLFAQKTPGIEIEINDRGIFEGFDAPARFFLKLIGNEDNTQFPGFLVLHMAVNPVIEINKTGKKAKAAWFSPGLVTFPVDGKLTAIWNYAKYGMEYVKEDDQWKILKLRWHQIFSTPFNKGWVEMPLFDQDNEKKSQTKKHIYDRPSAPDFHNPYKPDKFIRFEPLPPETFD